MEKIVTFPIDGAVSMGDLKIIGEVIKMPDMNPEYKYCIIGTNEDGQNVYVSKDGKSYNFAVSVKIGNEEYSRNVILELYRRVYND